MVYVLYLVVTKIIQEEEYLRRFHGKYNLVV